MTKYPAISVLLILFSFTSYPQLKNAPKLNVGIAKRPELFELANYYVRGGPDKDYQFYLSYVDNPNLVVELSQRLNHERWLVQFSNYFSYNYLVTPLDSFNRRQEDLNSFKYDFFFDVNYEIRFRKHKHSFIYIGAGVGRMNNGKKIDYNEATGEIDNNGNSIYIKGSTDFSFWAPRISVGFAFKNLSAFVTAHITPDEYLDPYPSLWVEYKLLYSFQLKKKKGRL